MNILLNEKDLCIQETYQPDKKTLITSASDVENIKPFVSLNLFTAQNLHGAHKPTLIPASGKAIITYVISGEAAYTDSTGKRGILKKDGWSWVISGSGIWHSMEPITDDYRGLELVIALSPALENSAPQSAYLNPEVSAQRDTAQVLIGWHGKQRSQFAIPSLTNYLVVHLNAQQTWCYDLPLNHQFAWVAVVSGSVETRAGEPLSESFMVTNRPTEKIELHALTDSILVLGSALEFAYDLVFQKDSVHTSIEALDLGVKGISAAAKSFPR
jgi:redox-sensitive bicupin YhaK (pirin superfamily)